MSYRPVTGVRAMNDDPRIFLNSCNNVFLEPNDFILKDKVCFSTFWFSNRSDSESTLELTNTGPPVSYHMTSNQVEPDHLIFRTRLTGKDRYSGSFNTVRLNLDILKTHFALPLRVAAVRLGLCETVLKRSGRLNARYSSLHCTDL